MLPSYCSCSKNCFILSQRSCSEDTMTIEMILVAARKCFGCNAVRMGCVAVIFTMLQLLLLASGSAAATEGGHCC